MISIGAELAGFLYIEHFAAFVRAALRAGTVRQLALMAVRALGKSGSGQRVVGAAF